LTDGDATTGGWGPVAWGATNWETAWRREAVGVMAGNLVD
jgi:hypothetical protein